MRTYDNGGHTYESYRQQEYLFKTTSLAGCRLPKRPPALGSTVSKTHRASNKIELVVCTRMAKMDTIFTQKASLPIQDLGIWPVAQAPASLGTNRYEHPKTSASSPFQRCLSGRLPKRPQALISTVSNTQNNNQTFTCGAHTHCNNGYDIHTENKFVFSRPRDLARTHIKNGYDIHTESKFTFSRPRDLAGSPSTRKPWDQPL